MLVPSSFSLLTQTKFPIRFNGREKNEIEGSTKLHAMLVSFYYKQLST